MSFSVGDVVNVPFPNEEDSTKSTLRPAIISEDLQDEVELVFISKQTLQQRHYEDSFIVTEKSPEGKAMGLTFDSLIAPKRTVTLKKICITPPIRGKCPTFILSKILSLL